MKNYLFLFLLTCFISCNSGDEIPCTPIKWYVDNDTDGLGNPTISMDSCDQPEGYVSNNQDDNDQGSTDNQDDNDQELTDPRLIFTSGVQKPFFLNGTNAAYAFFLYTPTEYDGSSDDKYPLLVHLHGAGARGDGMSDAAMNLITFDGPPTLINSNRWKPSSPMIVVAPQSAQLWTPNKLHDFIDYLILNLKIDPARIYMTGFSMGGRGIFDYVTEKGDDAHTTAVVPIAGWSIVNDGKPFKNVALWAFHGDSDPSVNVNGSINMVNAINSSSPIEKAKLTIFPGVAHNSWERVYNGSGMNTEDLGYDPFDLSIYDWMLQHKK